MDEQNHSLMGIIAASKRPDRPDPFEFSQSFDLARRGGKLNAVQIAHLGNLLESPQFAAHSLSDFILRKNFGGGPQFDPSLSPQANTRGVGLWKRYINAIRNNNPL